MEVNLGVKRICDRCKYEYTFPPGNYSPNDLREILKWVGTVGFKQVSEQELQPVLRHYCTVACATAALMQEEVYFSAPGSIETGNPKDMAYLKSLAKKEN